MSRFHNKSIIPQGMLAPNGLGPTVVNPNVQMTTRPHGSLLVPSPGYDSVRAGKNIFQRGVPSGGFRPMEFAEDVGGSGALLSVVPGETTFDEASEWLPESPDSLPQGDMIISDRGSAQDPGFASMLHEAYGTIPDMGDRTRGRPRSRAAWNLQNPVRMLRADWAEDPALTILGCVGLIFLVGILENDLRRTYRSNRGRGVATEATAVPAAAAQTSGDVTAQALDDIGKAADQAVEKISNAADSAVSSIENAAKSTKNEVTD
jgi:hypothetical protein